MWVVRNITEDDVDLFRRRLDRGFGNDSSEDPDARRRFTDVFELDRTLAAFDDDDIVGTAGALSFDLTVPGGNTVPMGGTTIVSVQPTHRRRGVLRAMMDAHLDDVAARAEPLAGLWASESSIYGRFGYGPATYRHVVSFDSAAADFREASSVRVELFDSPAEAAPLMKEIYERVRPTVSGMLSRSEQWWEVRHLHDAEQHRRGMSRRRFAICTSNGEPAGYATYRQKSQWEDFIANGKIGVEEVIAVDPTAQMALFRYLANIDLFTEVEWWNARIDDHLPLSITDSRRIKRKVVDGMWIRLMDVPAALHARTYETDGSVTIDVEDDTRPEVSGTYSLEVVDGVARCERTTGAAELACAIDVLGHLYLGGGDAYAMAAAGRLRGEVEAVRRAHRMFRSDRAPWCPEVF